MSLKQIIAAAGVVFVLLVLIKVFNISYPVYVVNTNRSSELSVVGEGKVDVAPDTGYVDVGISTNASPSVEEAQKTINETNNKIVAAMKNLGISAADIKTSNYSIYPNYVYENNQNVEKGFNGNVTVSIKIKNVQDTAKVIQDATKAGANQVQGTRFAIDDPDKYRKEARDKAIANAKTEANKLANELGIKLGRITNVVETNPDVVGMPLYAKEAANTMGGAGGGGPAPDVQPGSQTITSVVTLFFEKQ